MHKTANYTIYLGAVSMCVTALSIASAAPASTPSPANTYLVHNLVSDLPNTADFQDPNLVNPWGVAFGPTPFWIGNNGSGTATLHTGTGTAIPLVVTIPQAGGKGTT